MQLGYLYAYFKEIICNVNEQKALKSMYSTVLNVILNQQKNFASDHTASRWY